MKEIKSRKIYIVKNPAILTGGVWNTLFVKKLY